MALDVLVTGNTTTWSLTATKDGAPWDITGATVTLFLRRPDATVITCVATVDTGSSGTAHYDLQATDLDVEGLWQRSWQVELNGEILEYQPIGFLVVDGLG